MIAYLQGQILKKLDKNIIVQTGQIGYLIQVSTLVLDQMKEKEEVELFIYTKVREDDISLYGFKKMSELEFFKAVLSVNGIGPKSALEILSFDIEKTKAAILQDNLAYLSKIPGIGKKTAERIVLDLKSKIIPEDLNSLGESNNIEKDFENAIGALTNLGYQRFEVMKVLKNLPKEIKESEDIVTYFLQNV